MPTSPAFDAARKRDQQERRRQLTEIERRQSGVDEIGPARLAQIAGQERVGAEIERPDAAEDQTEPPDVPSRPIGPPPSRDSCHRCGLVARRQHKEQNSDGDDGRRPKRECEAPVVSKRGQQPW